MSHRSDRRTRSWARFVAVPLGVLAIAWMARRALRAAAL
jgi:hypothetical protein